MRRSGKIKLKKQDIVRIGNSTLPWLNYFTGATGGPTDVGTVVVPGGGNWNPPVEEKGNGFGIAALVCGILGVSVLAIVFGAIAMNRNEKNRGLGIAGLILGIVWAVFALVVWIIRFATY